MLHTVYDYDWKIVEISTVCDNNWICRALQLFVMYKFHKYSHRAVKFTTNSSKDLLYSSILSLVLASSSVSDNKAISSISAK